MGAKPTSNSLDSFYLCCLASAIAGSLKAMLCVAANWREPRNAERCYKDVLLLLLTDQIDLQSILKLL